ncbi:unnamed protein product, partial [Adineta ricciae]
SYKQSRANSAESNSNSSLPPSPARVTKSYDLNQGSNSRARQRRRESKLRSSSTECTTPTDSPSQTIVATDNDSPKQQESPDNLTEELEKKKEAEKDANDLVFMLTATLQLPPVNRPVNDENNRPWSSGDRTVASSLNETHRLHQRCNQIRQQCLQEISPPKLKRVLEIVENVSGAQIIPEMIYELGEDIYNKYSAQIFSLKFYEDALLIYS